MKTVMVDEVFVSLFEVTADPPGKETAGESGWSEKWKRLTDLAADNGKLDSIEGPAVVDVRKKLAVTPRTANQKSSAVVH